MMPDSAPLADTGPDRLADRLADPLADPLAERIDHRYADPTPLVGDGVSPRMVAAIDYLTGHWDDQPSLEALAAIAGLSPHHFQREFKRHVGLSPKRFGQFLTVTEAKSLLSNRASVLDAALDCGLSGPGRLHDLFVACEAMTPGEYKALGRDLVIRWGLHDVAIGRVLVGLTDRGVAWLSFVMDDDDGEAIAEMRDNWGLASFTHDPHTTGAVARAAFAVDPSDRRPLTLVLRGTNFQIKVWQALLAIPPGRIASYGDIAKAIGQPTASRAVGAAVGSNQVSFLIPCHRVIRDSGLIHAYRWGTLRKRALLAWELGLAGQAAE